MNSIRISKKGKEKLEAMKKELNLDKLSDDIRCATPKDYYNEGLREVLDFINNDIGKCECAYCEGKKLAYEDLEKFINSKLQ